MHALRHKAFRDWVTSPDFPEHAKPTYLDGDAWVDMSPESVETHNKVKLEFTVKLAGLVRRRDLGEAYADGVLFTNERAAVSTEPDFTFVSWASFRAGRVKLTRRKDRDDEFVELVGTPDLVLEVVSKSSVRKDMARLRAAYFRAGIREYWVVDAQHPNVHFEILQRAPRAYRASAPLTSPQVSRVLGARFTLTRKRNRLGRYAYTLAATALPRARG
jgi:Uma2 family endonuclease